MYDYISGKITSITPTQVVVDISGIGYLLNISLYTFGSLEGKKESKLYVHQIVREDDLQLYGFETVFERFIFSNLLSVSGIGPNTARIVLSYMSPEETRDAILQENEFAFKKVKGVGPKTAKRLIIDLKDKMMKLGEGEASQVQNSAKQTPNNIHSEALSALQALGFVKAKVNKVVNSIVHGTNAPETVEELIKKALKELS